MKRKLALALVVALVSLAGITALAESGWGGLLDALMTASSTPEPEKKMSAGMWVDHDGTLRRIFIFADGYGYLHEVSDNAYQLMPVTCEEENGAFTLRLVKDGDAEPTAVTFDIQEHSYNDEADMELDFGLLTGEGGASQMKTFHREAFMDDSGYAYTIDHEKTRPWWRAMPCGRRHWRSRAPWADCR